MNARLYRIILPIKDINKAEKFYALLFEQKGTRVSPGRHYFNLGGIILAVYDPVADEDEPGDWKFHENQYVYIAVSDLNKVFEKIKTMGCTYLSDIDKMPWGETLFYTRDPFGNRLCFVDEKTIYTGE